MRASLKDGLRVVTEMEQLSGVVERITFANEENGFNVIKIRSRGFDELVTVVGNLGVVNVGSVLEFKGDWKNDSKFGKQFVASEFRESLPATVAGIEKYLGSGLVKGIGPVFAKRIVSHFKEKTLEIIEESPDRLLEVAGIGSKRVDVVKKAWIEQKEIKNVMLFLQSHGVSTAYSVKIYKTYGDKSIDVVRENPYKLADDIWGIGFKTADTIAQKLGIKADSPARIRSGVIYTLNSLSEEGHCFSLRWELLIRSAEILEVEKELIEAVLDKMIVDKDVFCEDEAIFPTFLYYSEVGVSEKIKKIVSNQKSFSADIDSVIEKIQNESGIRYDPIQVEAVKQAVISRFMVLTGGPGTGKTTTTLAIIRVFDAIGVKVLLAAPTGRAAKRMSEATGMEAKTIHRLLEYKPSEGYKKNEDAPLDCDVLIVDESSMIDLVLMYNLLKAVAENTCVIMVGDVDQLPSVGPGNVLKDIISSGSVPVVSLRTIFRQAQGSMIVVNAHKINQGQMPILKNSKDNDFFFIEEENPAKIIDNIKELCQKRLPGHYKADAFNDIQVLCPMQRGELGARNINAILQEALNPHALSIKYGGVTYKCRDKVMQIKNNYDKNVFNGDIGRIVDIDLEDRSVLISFDGNDVPYDVTELDEIVLAYATTVHKSQGSEYKIVVAPVSVQHYVMLQRNLLYTMITRAKKTIVLVGTKKALAMAVRNDKIAMRNTMLSKRLK